ncbi:hypothetical protein ACXET9_12125 [Brachybacterium sp. DNPG3]
MSDRHVTAVVLLNGTTTRSTQEATLAAVSAQTRPADRVLVVAPATLDEDLDRSLRSAAIDGEVDDLLTTSSAVGRSGAVREVIDLLEDDRRGREGAEPEEDPQDLLFDDGDDGAQDLAQRDGVSRSTGRRAAAIDREAAERLAILEAEYLARIPERLREKRRRAGRRVASAKDEQWLWFVVDGALPAEDALERELEVLTRSPNTAVVGAKRVRHGERRIERAREAGETGPLPPEDADILVDVGLTLTHSGTIITGVDPGEIDQGQSDWRHDVLAVALPGMLIRASTLVDSQGLDPALPEPWAEIDLCRRIWRSGERVAVQSSARVVFPPPARPLLERLQDQRAGQILALLKQRRLAGSLLLIAVLPLLTLLRMVGALASVMPRRAGMEARAWATAMRRTPAVMGRGLRPRPRARVPRGRLAPLYLPRGESIRRALEDTWTRLVADDDRTRRIRRTTWGVAGTRHGVEDADYGRHIVWTIVVLLSTTALGMLALRGLFGQGTIVGPALLALPDSWRDTAEAAWSTWIAGGLGDRGPADPLIRLLGHLPIDGAVLIEVLVMAAIPASALAAWWAAGAITRAIGARLVLTVTWALAPVVITALASGAWPLLLVHVLLPLLALAVGRAVGLPHKISQASVPAAAAAGLVLLVIGAVQPVLVLVVIVALMLLAPAVPGRRARLLWVPLPSLALHAPFLPVYLGHPETLLAVGGIRSLPSGASTAELLMLWPSASGLPALLAPHIGAEIAAWVPALSLVPVVLGALGAPFLRGTAGLAGRFALLAAAAGMIGVLLASRTLVAVAGDEAVTADVHALLDLVLLALGVGAAASFDALARRDGGMHRARRLLTSAVAVVAAAICTVTVVGWTLLLPGTLEISRSTSGEIPAAAADQSRSDARSRVLVLAEADDGSVTARIVVGGGETALQRAAIVDARQADLVAAGEVVDGDAGSEAVRAAVARMLSSSGAEAEDATLAVSYVLVGGDLSAQTDLVAALDASTGLEKVTVNSAGGMWRVIDSRERAVVLDADGTATPLASSLVGATGSVSSSSAERTIVLSERYDSGWRAEVGGHRLEPVLVDGWAQGFVLPAGVSGDVEVHRDQAFTPLWRGLLYAAVAATGIIAIPWRPRSRGAEDLYG